MSRAQRLIIAAMLIGVPISVAAAQLPQRDARPTPATSGAAAAPAPTGTASLSGVVVADAGGTAIRQANVVLVGITTGVLKVSSTDATGRFSFGELPADRYTVGASKLPYLGAVAGARRPVRPGTPIVVTEGATVADVTIRLPMGSAISGRVLDERGQPAPDVSVRVQQRKVQNGARVFVDAPGGAVFTDDRGTYRVFGLPPGEYVVSAVPGRGTPGHTLVPGTRMLTDADVDAVLAGMPMRPTASVTEENLKLAPIYYPGTPRVDDAGSVTLSAGDDRQNVDLRLQRVAVADISGTVTGPDGAPAIGVQISLNSAGGGVANYGTASQGGSLRGRFVLSGIPPGSYTLAARTVGLRDNLFAEARFDVSGMNITDVALTLAPTLTLSGRVSIADTVSLPSLAGHQVQMTPLVASSPRGVPAPSAGVTMVDGRFAIRGIVPGPYQIGVPLVGTGSDSVTLGLVSVTVDGQDVTDRPLVVTSQMEPDAVTLTFSDVWQQVSGRLSDETGAPLSDYTVLVFPTDSAYWLYGSRRIVSARPGTDGRFALGGPGPSLLPAGDYYLAAVTDVSKDEQYDPAFLQSIVGASLRVTLAPGEKHVQDLRVR